MACHNKIGNPSPWVTAHAARAQPGCTVLDIACGSGRHLRFFHARGHPVTGIDINLAGITDLLGKPGVDLVQCDLEARDAEWPMGNTQFGVVVVTNYLWRPLLPHIVGSVAPGGMLIYETFMRGHERFGSPRNPDFLLMPGELKSAVAGELSVVAYEETEEATPKPAQRQHICAIRSA